MTDRCAIRRVTCVPRVLRVLARPLLLRQQPETNHAVSSTPAAGEKSRHVSSPSRSPGDVGSPLLDAKNPQRDQGAGRVAASTAVPREGLGEAESKKGEGRGTTVYYYPRQCALQVWHGCGMGMVWYSMGVDIS